MLQTATHATIMLLLRDVPLSDGAQTSVAGYVVTIVGDARPRDWPDHDLHAGDRSGVIWAEPRDVPSTIDNLVCDPHVVAARQG